MVPPAGDEVDTLEVGDRAAGGLVVENRSLLRHRLTAITQRRRPHMELQLFRGGAAARPIIVQEVRW
jgi:hypothetical protein